MHQDEEEKKRSHQVSEKLLTPLLLLLSAFLQQHLVWEGGRWRKEEKLLFVVREIFLFGEWKRDHFWEKNRRDGRERQRDGKEPCCCFRCWKRFRLHFPPRSEYHQLSGYPQQSSKTISDSGFVPRTWLRRLADAAESVSNHILFSLNMGENTLLKHIINS